MNYAIKNKKKLVHACRLGDGSAMERQLIQEGAIRRLPDGSYELFSQEATQGKGELALPGDYFKVDTVEGHHYPYPNSKQFFEANHTLLDAAQDLYEQQPKPLQVWQKGDDMCPEIQFLLDTGRLQICPEDPERYFQAELFGAPLSTSDRGTVVFYSMVRNLDGTVKDAGFNLVSEKDFAASYTFCTADGKPLKADEKKNG